MPRQKTFHTSIQLLKSVFVPFFLVFALSIFPRAMNAQALITGVVIDSETNEPLPFATVALAGKYSGTVTNKEGEFEVMVPDSINSLLVNYLGYQARQVRVSTQKKLTIALEPSIITLKELIIRPLSPSDYIKRAVNNIGSNYPTDPFNTTAYYREKFTENGQFIAFTEAIFKSYYPSYIDTVSNQHQLILYNKANELHEIAFMKQKREKKEAKERRKAERKGKEFDEDDAESIIVSEFGGPENILEQDVIRELEPYIDSIEFKKFNYEFSGASTYHDRDLLVISFKSKRPVDHVMYQGEIYLDSRTDAFVAIEYRAEVRVPVAIKPLLLAFGISLKNPTFNKQLRYGYQDGVWIPENIQWSANLEITKAYIFQKNETSNFEIEQVFTISDALSDNPIPIPEQYQFDPEDAMVDQVMPIEGLTWDNFNVIKPEELVTIEDE